MRVLPDLGTPGDRCPECHDVWLAVRIVATAARRKHQFHLAEEAHAVLPALPPRQPGTRQFGKAIPHAIGPSEGLVGALALLAVCLPPAPISAGAAGMLLPSLLRGGPTKDSPLAVAIAIDSFFVISQAFHQFQVA
jgi:hypothetical protein